MRPAYTGRSPDPQPLRRARGRGRGRGISRGDSMDIRWGFIGAGNVTQAKASPPGAFTQEGSRVVAVARADAARAEAYAQANGIARAYGTVEELCADPEVNAVFVCT